MRAVYRIAGYRNQREAGIANYVIFAGAPCDLNPDVPSSALHWPT
jgi:hypothetical protein